MFFQHATNLNMVSTAKRRAATALMTQSVTSLTARALASAFPVSRANGVINVRKYILPFVGAIKQPLIDQINKCKGHEGTCMLSLNIMKFLQ